MYFLCNTFVHDDTLILAYFKEVKTHTNKKALMRKDIYMRHCSRKAYTSLIVTHFVSVIINLCYMGEIVIVPLDTSILPFVY